MENQKTKNYAKVRHPTHPDLLSEDELVFSIKNNDRAAFDYLFTKYAPLTYAKMNKTAPDHLSAETLLQEAFVRIWNSIDQYDKTKNKLWAWMLIIAKSTVKG